ncbi:hypothetical protein ATL39_0926 [Sinobaca qinghaiensis]|uniref:Uncharacterized protein n=1 Tax=Sinobaca qinghaiensis TaxID=342944 RepID=A0A419V5K4_9BACL|nr:hypothetical protein ATL39_0926 [Sinobaca qinghaiensis]
MVPVESADDAYTVTTDEDTFEAIKPSPVLDNHPSLGWMLKNSSETIAYAIKVKKQDHPV